MATTPALTNSAAMLSVPGICSQLSAVSSPLVQYLYRSDLYSANLFSIFRSSVRHFPNFPCMIADLPCFSVVKNLIS